MHPRMIAQSSTPIGKIPMAGIHLLVHGTSTTKGKCRTKRTAIVIQNHGRPFNSQRTFITVTNTRAQTHAALPVPGFPCRSKKKKSGDVNTTAEIANSQFLIPLGPPPIIELHSYTICILLSRKCRIQQLPQRRPYRGKELLRQGFCRSKPSPHPARKGLIR